MVSVGFQYTLVSLDVNEVCFDEEQGIFKMREKPRKSQSVNEWCRCEKSGLMDTNVKCLSCGKVDGLAYFQLSDMRVFEIVSTTVHQLYLI